MGRRVLTWPLVWLVAGFTLLFVIPTYVVLPRAAEALISWHWSAFTIARLVIAFGVYALVMRWLARRRMPELAGAHAPRFWVEGAALGAGTIGLAALILTGGGWYRFTAAQDVAWPAPLMLLVTMLGPAVFEELAFRGIMQQALERLAGALPALLVTSAVFGVVHLDNPDATAWSTTALAVYGLLYGAAFLWRRSLWLVIGAHYAWNLTTALLGIPVSGIPVHGRLLDLTTTGPALLTGGAFGIETSLILVVLAAALAGVLYTRRTAPPDDALTPRGP